MVRVKTNWSYININVEPTLAERMKLHAEQQERTVAWIARKAIVEYLDRVELKRKEGE